MPFLPHKPNQDHRKTGHHRQQRRHDTSYSLREPGIHVQVKWTGTEMKTQVKIQLCNNSVRNIRNNNQMLPSYS